MLRYLLGRLIMTLFACICCTFLITTASADGGAKKINTNASNVAILGYDTVAYFTLAKATKGKPEFNASWQDVTWHFASAENRELFVADPQHYAPKFGGFCAMALTRGVVKTIDPQAWVIVDGRLYLNFSDDARDRLEHDLHGNIERSERNWAELQARN